MTGRPMIPGVPAAGHLSDRGYWHPGKPEGCVKCTPPTPQRPRHRGAARCEAHARRGTGTGMCDAPLDHHGNCPRASDHLED